MKIILCVDDEEMILKSLQRSLRGVDYKLFLTSDIDKALQIVKRYDVQVVISDYRMQTMTGLDFLKKVREIKPHAIRVILSGFAEERAIQDALRSKQIHHYLVKPWNSEKLKKDIQSFFKLYNQEAA